MAILTILSGKLQGKRVALPEGEVTVGRDVTCQIRLATSEVSRVHCKLICTSNSVTVRDLGSRNGTLINGEQVVHEQVLEPGDVLRVGPVSFQLVGKKEGVSPLESGTTSAKAKNPTDDSILNWLAEGEEEETEDTTDVGKTDSPRQKPASTSQSIEEPPPLSNPTPLPTAEKKKFRNIGEEGNDIIQRHLAVIQSEQLPKQIPAIKPNR